MQNGGFVNKIQGVRLSVAKIHRHVFENPGYKSNFYAGIRKAIMEAGNELIITDTIPLYLVQKPL